MGTTKARNTRRRRAAALRALAAGRVPLRDVVQDGLGSLGSCPIHRVLQAAPGMGPETVRRTLERANVWPLLPLEKLSELERGSIIDQLPERIA